MLTIAFAVCAAWMLGDSLAFIANFQPTLIVPLLVGKLIGALAGLGIAHWLSVPAALEYERHESSALYDEDAEVLVLSTST
ncbi:Ethanolamine utilization protein, EutH [compost metagenome]